MQSFVVQSPGYFGCYRRSRPVSDFFGGGLERRETCGWYQSTRGCIEGQADDIPNMKGGRGFQLQLQLAGFWAKAARDR